MNKAFLLVAAIAVLNLPLAAAEAEPPVTYLCVYDLEKDGTLDMSQVKARLEKGETVVLFNEGSLDMLRQKDGMIQSVALMNCDDGVQRFEIHCSIGTMPDEFAIVAIGGTSGQCKLGKSGTELVLNIDSICIGGYGLDNLPPGYNAVRFSFEAQYTAERIARELDAAKNACVPVEKLKAAEAIGKARMQKMFENANQEGPKAMKATQDIIDGLIDDPATSGHVGKQSETSYLCTYDLVPGPNGGQDLGDVSVSHQKSIAALLKQGKTVVTYDHNSIVIRRISGNKELQLALLLDKNLAVVRSYSLGEDGLPSSMLLCTQGPMTLTAGQNGLVRSVSVDIDYFWLAPGYNSNDGDMGLPGGRTVKGIKAAANTLAAVLISNLEAARRLNEYRSQLMGGCDAKLKEAEARIQEFKKKTEVEAQKRRNAALRILQTK